MALKAALARRKPPPSCIHRSDRGLQYAAEAYRNTLETGRLIGSMGRRGNPYAKAESFMKTLKVEAVYPMAFENFDDVIEHLPHFIKEVYNRRRLHSALGYLSPSRHSADGQNCGLIFVRPQGAHSTSRTSSVPGGYFFDANQTAIVTIVLRLFLTGTTIGLRVAVPACEPTVR